MEVILLEDVETLGSRGQTVKVAGGYGRNFLLPKKLAVAATPQNRKWAAQLRVRFVKQSAKEKGEAGELANLLEGVAVTIRRKAGEQGTLFGSVTAMDVAAELAKKGFHIDRRKIQLDSPLKLLGEYDVTVKLHREVAAKVKVKIEGDTPAPAATAETPAATPEAPKG